LYGPLKIWYPTTSLNGDITHLHPEDRGSIVIRNFGILPHH